MGDIVKITGKAVLPDPEGWNIPQEQFNLPFTVELKENFHIHWQDLRIEMMPKDFEKFAQAIIKSYQKWTDDGDCPCPASESVITTLNQRQQLMAQQGIETLRARNQAKT